MKPLKFAGLTLTTLSLAAGTAHAATNIFSNTSGNLWDTAANWTDGLPDTNDDLEIGTGLTAVSNTATPATSTGSLTMQVNSTVRISAATGAGEMFDTASSVIFQGGNTIDYTTTAATNFSPMVINGNASITNSGNNNTNGSTKSFEGISGSGNLTITAADNQGYNVTTTNSSFTGDWIFNGQKRHVINFEAIGSGGTGDVFLSGTPSAGASRSGVIVFGANDVFANSAFFTVVDADGYTGSSGKASGSYFMDIKAFTDTIGGMTIDGNPVTAGDYTGSGTTGTQVSWLSGTGVLTIVPEPSSALLGGLGFLLLLRRRR